MLFYSIFSIIAILSFFVLPCSAQYIVEEQNIPQEGLTYYSLWMTSPQQGVVVGDHGKILHTIDGFVTYTVIATHTTKNLYAVRFFDDIHGISVGQHGVILRTDNGGISWESMTSGVQDDLYSIAIIGKSDAKVVGEAGTLLETTNQGVSWSKKDIGIPFRFRSIRFHDIVKGIIVGDSGTVLRTNDGGKNWSKIEGVTSKNIFAVAWAIDSIVVIVGSGGLILRSEDSGEHWQIPDTIVRLNIYYRTLKSIHFINDSVGIIGGIITTVNPVPNGITTSILRTRNKGKIWLSPDSVVQKYKSEVTNPQLLDFQSFGDTLTYAVGYDYLFKTGVVLSASNKSYVWKYNFFKNNGYFFNSKDQQITSFFNYISFAGDKTGFVVADAGTMLSTTNSGDTWLPIQTGIRNNINDVRAYDSMTIAATADSGIVMISTNGGTSFQYFTPMGDSSKLFNNRRFVALTFKDHRSLWLGYYRNWLLPDESGIILKLTDAQTITRVKITSANNDFYCDIKFTSSMQGWILGFRDFNWDTRIGRVILLHSTDGGNNWTESNLPSFDKNETIFGHITFSDSLHGWIPFYDETQTKNGTRYYLFTTDGGKSWVRRDASEHPKGLLKGFYVSKILFPDTMHGVISTFAPNTYLYYTKNGGDTWNYVDIDMREYGIDTIFHSVISYPTPKYCWTIGYPFRIWRITFDNVPDGVTENTEVITQNTLVRYYSNGKILIDIPKDREGIVSVKIYNILGNKVSRAYSLSYKEHILNIELNSEDFPSGIYYVEITGGGYRKAVPIVIAR
jgi:photosystem II stability/assembly factor-like uncharacterized protein